MNKTPILSIIIPVFNTEKYIEDCLESIYSNNVATDMFQVVCVNDGSTDNSGNIIKEYMSKYPNLSYEVNAQSGGYQQQEIRD